MTIRETQLPTCNSIRAANSQHKGQDKDWALHVTNSAPTESKKASEVG
jgi:hypothetical protein